MLYDPSEAVEHGVQSAVRTGTAFLPCLALEQAAGEIEPRPGIRCVGLDVRTGAPSVQQLSSSGVAWAVFLEYYVKYEAALARDARHRIDHMAAVAALHPFAR